MVDLEDLSGLSQALTYLPENKNISPIVLSPYLPTGILGQYKRKNAEVRLERRKIEN